VEEDRFDVFFIGSDGRQKHYSSLVGVRIANNLRFVSVAIGIELPMGLGSLNEACLLNHSVGKNGASLKYTHVCVSGKMKGKNDGSSEKKRL